MTNDFDMPSRGRIVRWIIGSLIAVFLLGLLGLGFKSYFYPRFLAVERSGQVQSHQYVESQRTFLMQKLTAIEELEVEILELKAQEPVNEELVAAKEAQIKAFEQEMRRRVELILPEAVPPAVRDFLEERENE